MMKRFKKQMRLGIVIGTGIQEKICRTIYPSLKNSCYIGEPLIISLQNYYRLGISHGGLGDTKLLHDLLRKNWYDRSRFIKLISLCPYLIQLFMLTFQIRHFMFFVDTGVLERSAIIFLQIIGCKVVVLQDAMKRIPAQGTKKSLTWFGGGGADLYLLLGEQYRSMIGNGSKIEIVGSPIYVKEDTHFKPGNRILIVNQCFAKYGEVSPEVEYEFIKRTIEVAVQYGPIELRLHPHNDRDQYMDLASSRIVVSQRRPIKKSLIDAGIVIGINSTVLLEALILGRPVLTLNWHPSPFRQPIPDFVTRCNNLTHLSQALEAWKNNPDSYLMDKEKLDSMLKDFIAFDGEKSIQLIKKTLEVFIGDTKEN